MGFLTAYSYERGGSTIWGPVILHAVNNALVMLLFFPADIQPAASSLYIVLGIIMSILILVRATGQVMRTALAATGPVVVGA
ncbi:MAG: hypothetical protein IPK19_05495 [Chloroflexi bacterium]|nr:hypothetical protein [Chloroflexota bacterium]